MHCQNRRDRCLEGLGTKKEEKERKRKKKEREKEDEERKRKKIGKDKRGQQGKNGERGR